MTKTYTGLAKKIHEQIPPIAILLTVLLLSSAAFAGNPIDFSTYNTSLGKITLYQECEISGLPSYAPNNTDSYSQVTNEMNPVVLADFNTAEVNKPPVNGFGGGVAKSSDFGMVWQIASGNSLNTYVMIDSHHLAQAYLPIKHPWHWTFATTNTTLGSEIVTVIVPDDSDPDYSNGDTVTVHGKMGFDASGWTTAPGSTQYALYGPEATYQIPIKFGNSFLTAQYLPNAPFGDNWDVTGIISEPNAANQNEESMLVVSQYFTHSELSNKEWLVVQVWNTGTDLDFLISMKININDVTPVSHECEASTDDNPEDYTTRLERKFYSKGFVNVTSLMSRP